MKRIASEIRDIVDDLEESLSVVPGKENEETLEALRQQRQKQEKLNLIKKRHPELQKSKHAPASRDEFTVEEVENPAPPEGDVLEVEEELKDATKKPEDEDVAPAEVEQEGHEKDKFLDLSDVRLLALTFADKYGYEDDAVNIPAPSNE